MSINISRRRTLTELEYWEYRASVTGRKGWTHYEAVGRCLRYLKNNRASETFLLAANDYQAYFPSSIEQNQLLLANMYRLAGDEDAARHHYRTAYDLITQKPNYADGEAAVVALAGYMLGRYDEVIPAIVRVQKAQRGLGWHELYLLADLAKARQANDVALAHAALHQIETFIKKKRRYPWDEGSNFSAWDAYELARETVRDLGGNPDAG